MSHTSEHLLLKGRLDLSGPLGSRCRLLCDGSSLELDAGSLAGLWRLGRALGRSAGALRPALRHAGDSLRSAGLDCRINVAGIGVACIGREARSGPLSRLLGIGSVSVLWRGVARALLTGRARA